MIFQCRPLNYVFVLAIAVLVINGASSAMAQAKRADNVTIQILSSANGKGEIGECE